MSRNNEELSNEQVFINAFGEGYWDLPEYERFEMTVKKMLGQNVEKVSKEDARRYNEGQELHNRAESGS